MSALVHLGRSYVALLTLSTVKHKMVVQMTCLVAAVDLDNVDCCGLVPRL